MIAAGQLRHRVTLQALVETRDSFGQLVESWADAGTFWAFVRPTGGAEAVNAGQTKAEATDRVTMRYQGSAPIGPTARLLFRGRTLNILQVNDVDERLRELDILCKEVVSPP